jgi:SAM-dependent methyltransferase
VSVDQGAAPAGGGGGPAVEILDRPSLSYDQRRRALADLARVNRWLLGNRPLVAALAGRIAAGPPRQRLLDLGTGSGEAAARLVGAAARAGVEVAVVGLDRCLAHLVIGRARGIAQRRVVATATALPFRDGAFDWTLSTLFFHHFDPADNRRVLAEMRRTGRWAAVVDLRRSPATTLLARLLLPLVGVAHTARHDGLVSVARAFTVAEVARLTAGLPVAELRRRFPRRFSLVLQGASSPRPPTPP